MDLAQVDRLIIVEPSVYQETSEDVPVMNHLKLVMLPENGGRDNRKTLKLG